MKVLFYHSKFSEILRQYQHCIKINTDSSKFADVGHFRRMTAFVGKNDVIMASWRDDDVTNQTKIAKLFLTITQAYWQNFM